MNIFGHRRRWYIEQYVKFRYYRSRGNSMTGELKGLWAAITGGGIIILLVDRVWDILLPIWILGVAWLIQGFIEIFLGILDRRKLKMWQMEYEYVQRKKIDPWAVEQMDRIKDIQKKVSPETVNKQYKTFIDEH